jgi:paraquat-inducible protein B
MSDSPATVTPQRRMSLIWTVPIVALVLGAWMVVFTLRSQGPEISIVFSTAEGVEAGKTKIKVRSVEVGVVESATLGDDSESVLITARLDKNATALLREDTRFWVVRPRIGTEGVSGLGTLLSGGYIRLAPGTGKRGEREFVGLEVPPVTPMGTPGLSVKLISDHAGSVSTGDPILYKRYRVGRIESSRFDIESQKMHYGAFIEAPYDKLISSATRFWNASGVSMNISAEGISVDTASLESLLIGGISMGLPEGVEEGDLVTTGATFTLYPDQDAVNARPHTANIEYVVGFEQSVRGLEPGAPVEYRGIRVGQVERILVREMAAGGVYGDGAPIPVLIRLQPARIDLPDNEEGKLNLSQAMTNAVGNGLRATLATGSLLTGSLYVSLDIYGDEPFADMGSFGEHETIPSIESGLSGIERKFASLLDKFNALPLEATVEQLTASLGEVNKLLASPDMQSLPGSLRITLSDLSNTLNSVSSDSELQEQLRSTLSSLKELADTLNEQPNSLIFDREAVEDLQPPAGTP